MTLITGAGSGKGSSGSSRTPKTARDSLDSRQFANVTEVIAEGPIEGLADGLKSVFFNDTALQNADGTYNFEDVDLYERTGTDPQEVIPLDSSRAVLSVTGVSTPVVKDLPLVRTATNVNTDAIRVTISIPALQRIDASTGDTSGSSLSLKVNIKYKLAVAPYTETSWIEKISDEIKGRTADEYRREYEIRLDRTTYDNHTVDIQVVRVTDDSTDALLQNSLTWSSFTAVQWTPQTYPNTALIGVRLDAQQFSSVPSRKYLIKGLKVPIPTGVSVDQTTGRIIYPANYVWDGTFTAAQWTSCPSWLLYAFLINQRFGLGDHLDASQLDKWSFFRASKYANEEVDNQAGGTEARFSCNTTISSTKEAFSLVNELLSVMRCQGFWESGRLAIAQDSPSDVIYNFNQSNVTEEGFSYTNQSSKTKPTVVVVAYLDLVLKDMSYEVVKDDAEIARRGIVKKSVQAFACTSRAQAQRVGRWLLYEENNTEAISFTSSLTTAQLIKPGHIISVADPLKAGSRRAGRIKSATINEITIDDGAVLSDLTLGTSPILSIILPDGTLEGRQVSDIGNYVLVGYVDADYSLGDGVITVNSNYSAIPLNNSIWVIENQELETSLWRVISIKENEKLLYTVEAIAHNESKYNHIETGSALETRDTTNLNVAPEAPANVEILTVKRYDGTETKELQYEINGKISIKITFHWAGISGVDRYRVRWRHEDDNFKTELINGTTLDINDAKRGTYEVQVSSVSSSGLLFSAPAIGNYAVAGLQDNPDDIQNLSLVPISETLAVLSWKKVAQLDVQLGGRIIIRHDPRTTGSASWLTSNKVVDGVSGSSSQKQVPLLAGTYFVKAEDYLGNRSSTAASFTTSLPESTARFNVKTWSEETAFSGTKVNSGLAKSGNNLVLTPNPYVASGYHDPFYVDGDEGGEYTFATTFDFGHSGVQYDAVLRKEVISNSIGVVGVLFDSKTGLWDSGAGKIDGDVLDEANVDLFVRTTADDPSSSPTWSEWAEFEAAVIRARGVQVKASITSTSTEAKVTISDLGATLDLLGRTESASIAANTSASTGVYNVTFEKPFYQTPQIQITPTSSSTNLFVNVTNLSRTGFTATFNNGSAVDVEWMYSVTGYGRGI